MVKQVQTLEEFDNALKAAGAALVVVDFTATWCGPCKTIQPVFKKLEEKHPDVVFLKVDIDEAQEIAKFHRICSVPTFFFYKNSVKVDSFSGADQNQLIDKVEKHK